MNYKKARTDRDKIKLMTYIQYIQQCWKEKKQNHNKKMNVCQPRNISMCSRTALIRISSCPDRLSPKGRFVEALKLPVVGSSTVQCHDIWNFKSDVVERFTRRYIL